MENDHEIGNGQCLECGDSFIYGRHDRKFCSDECRNKFNNRRRRETKRAKMKIQQILERNYAVLDSLIKMRLKIISVQQLCQMGFNFEYMTSYHKNRRHDEYGCFDIRMVMMGDKIISLSREITPQQPPRSSPSSLTDGY